MKCEICESKEWVRKINCCAKCTTTAYVNSKRVSKEFELRLRQKVNSEKRNEKEILLKNNIDFAEDTLSCKYVYVIDFDKNSFEIYEDGFTKPLGTFSLNKLPTKEKLEKLEREVE